MKKTDDLLQIGVNWVFRNIPYKKPSPDLLKQVKIIAHRGYWNNADRIENTIPAFDICLNKNIWAIEFDIRWTRDNVPIVHHDETLTRLFLIDKKISDLTYLELNSLAPIIPTFASIIERFHKKIHLMIELKLMPTSEQTQILTQLLKPLKPIKDYHFMSLNLENFNPLSFLSSKTFVSIARANINTICEQTISREFGALTGHYLLLSNKMKEQCFKKNISTGTGFPDSKSTFYREVSRGVNWVFTNHALELSKLKLP